MLPQYVTKDLNNIAAIHLWNGFLYSRSRVMTYLDNFIFICANIIWFYLNITYVVQLLIIYVIVVILIAYLYTNYCAVVFAFSLMKIKAVVLHLMTH